MDERELRTLCLNEAVRAVGGAGMPPEAVIPTAEKFLAFVKGAATKPAAKPSKKKKRRGVR